MAKVKKETTKATVIPPKVPKEVLVKKPLTLNQALFGFQGENISIPRNGTGKSRDGRPYKYATLDDVMSMTRAPLQKYGLMITQPMSGNQLITKLVFAETGEELVSTLDLGKPESSQDLGARITYLRRYQTVSILGLTIEDDTDAVPTNVLANGGKSAIGEKNDTSIATIQKTVVVDKSNTQNTDSGLGAMPKHDSVVVPEQMTEQYKKAKAAIEGAMSIDALEMIAEKVKSSVKLNEVEKESLVEVVHAKETELVGTVR